MADLLCGDRHVCFLSEVPKIKNLNSPIVNWDFWFWIQRLSGSMCTIRASWFIPTHKLVSPPVPDRWTWIWRRLVSIGRIPGLLSY